jgi:hypothetical protein
MVPLAMISAFHSLAITDLALPDLSYIHHHSGSSLEIPSHWNPQVKKDLKSTLSLAVPFPRKTRPAV